MAHPVWTGQCVDTVCGGHRGGTVGGLVKVILINAILLGLAD